MKSTNVRKGIYHKVTKFIMQFTDGDRDVMEIPYVSDYVNPKTCQVSFCISVAKLGFKNIMVIVNGDRVFLVRFPI